MTDLQRLINFLDQLKARKIPYKLDKLRDSIVVELRIPGQRWEVEFRAGGEIEIEKFISDGTIFEEDQLELLFPAEGAQS